MTGAAFMTFSYLILAILDYTNPPGGQLGSGLLIYMTVFFFGISFGPVPYVKFKIVI